jgi:glutaminyl-tRNA synthetase
VIVPDDGAAAPADFIRAMVARDVATGKFGGRVVTRFPPEPNGQLHIGHAKSICLNFGVAEEFGGICHLRYDDTNPTAEEVEYVESIQEDVRWLGFDWGEHCYFASDYFQRLYEFAVELIAKGLAYVDDLSSEEITALRGTLTEPGSDSPHRTRSVTDNLDLFERMKAGEFENGERVLRAKIDMASTNLVMRDPILYRVHKVEHHRTGNKWCIYPMYDFAHCLSDAIESVTHSLCTLEFLDHRAIYDWLIEHVDAPSRPEQTEFARGNLTYTVLSKRVLLQLVEGGHVSGWDDPRMPSLAGIRRRGYPPAAIRRFWREIGVARRDNTIQLERLEHAVREELNAHAPRAMAVLNPLRVVIENYPEDRVEQLDAINNPEDPEMGTRKVPFSRVLYIERDDFLEDPPRKFFRLAPGREVRLRYAYFITCTDVVLHHLHRRREGRLGRDRRAALHLRSRDARWRRARRSQGEGHAALGVGRPRGDGRGAPLRQALQRRGPPRHARRSRVHALSQPRIAGAAGRLPLRALAGYGRAGLPRPVRTARLLLRRPRLAARCAGLQPHGDAARHLGKAGEAAARRRLGLNIGAIFEGAVAGQGSPGVQGAATRRSPPLRRRSLEVHLRCPAPSRDASSRR